MSKKKNSLTHPDPGVQPPSSTVGKTARNARAGPSTSPVDAPPYHPGTCGGVTPRPPIDFNESMALYAGKYKLSMTTSAPHCPPGGAPHPVGAHHGWFQFGWSNNACPNDCREVCTFDTLNSISFNVNESSVDWEQGWPNNENGGCDRNFEEYYLHWIGRHRVPKHEEETCNCHVSNPCTTGRYTVLIHSSAISTATTLRTDPWVKITFECARHVYPESSIAYINLFGVTQLTSNLPDIMNQQFDIFRPSAHTQINYWGEEVATVGVNPNYYYLFLEEN